MTATPANNTPNVEPVAPAQPSGPRLRVTWTKSAIGYSVRQKRTVEALGLRRLGHTVEKPDSPAVRGMLRKVAHLVTVEEVK